MIIAVLSLHAMILETAQSLASADATLEDIHNAIAEDALRGEYLILYRDESCFVQAAGDTEPFSVEYFDGTSERTCRCRQQLSSADLEQLLLRYLAGDPQWNEGYDWDAAPVKPWWKFR